MRNGVQQKVPGQTRIVDVVVHSRRLNVSATEGPFSLFCTDAAIQSTGSVSGRY